MPAFLWLLMLVYLDFSVIDYTLARMSTEEKRNLREQVREMFLHGYRNYKFHAFPADELMPLSCKGRIRDKVSSRGDVDDVLGNFSLTMIDSLDSLFILNELDEFEFAAKSVVESVSLDSDLDVSVFETNIRILGGLLGGHISALALRKSNSSRMSWYTDQLLQMAVDIGNRLLPAFNTSTGIPYPRINLRHGCEGLQRQEVHTCTACGGTMILEFAALSRLTGNPIYEQKAAHALAYIWKQRSRYSDLVGKVIDVRNGDWVQRDSGIGAGIDSYYEYLLKAYVLLGEPVYLHRFRTHYDAIKRFVSGPRSAAFPFLFLDVNMHRPSERARGYMDALFAFWPGLQVLSGDVKSAVALHEFIFQVHKRNKLLPEAFTPDLRVHWGEHLLRPEFAESTYLLYQATSDPYYLEVGAKLISDLQTYSRVPCGFAAIKDVRTMQHFDRFDSFVLAETFKYLYLLFSEPNDLPIRMSEYVLTTEAHLLPVGLSLIRISACDAFSHSMNASTMLNSNCSHTSSEDKTTSFADQHGDRDRAAEARLNYQATCPSVENFFDFFGSLADRKCDATKSSVSRTKIAPPDVCDVLDFPSVHRGRITLLHLMKQSVFHAHFPACNEVLNQRLWRTIELIRQPLRLLAIRSSPSTEDSRVKGLHQQAGKLPSDFIPLRAADFVPGDASQVLQMKRMGIDFVISEDGRVVLKQDQNTAEDPQLAIAGLVFMHELIELTQSRQQINVFTGNEIDKL